MKFAGRGVCGECLEIGRPFHHWNHWMCECQKIAVVDELGDEGLDKARYMEVPRYLSARPRYYVTTMC